MVIHMNKHGDSFLDLSSTTLEGLTEIFTALSIQTRLRILYLLIQRDCSVVQITELLGLTQSAVSHQLRDLRRWRLVQYRREGKEHIYYCRSKNLKIILEKAIYLLNKKE